MPHFPWHAHGRFLEAHYRNLTASVPGLPVVVLAVRAGPSLLLAEALGVEYRALPSLRVYSARAPGQAEGLVGGLGGTLELDGTDFATTPAVLEAEWRRASTEA